MKVFYKSVPTDVLTRERFDSYFRSLALCFMLLMEWCVVFVSEVVIRYL